MVLIHSKLPSGQRHIKVTNYRNNIVEIIATGLNAHKGDLKSVLTPINQLHRLLRRTKQNKEIQWCTWCSAQVKLVELFLTSHKILHISLQI